MTERELDRHAAHRPAVIRHAQELTGNVAKTCRYYEISRQVYYKWLRRYEVGGLEALRDRSLRPHVSPKATRAEVVGKIIYLRQTYHFGPHKIAMYLKRYHDRVIIFSGLFTAFGRLIGAVATMTVAWATILLFGRIPQSKQTLLSLITLGSLAWVAALAGVLVPTVGSFLLAAVPRASFIEDWWLRLVMLGLAVLLPFAIGFATINFIAPEDRPMGRARVTQLVRGYPYAAVYAITIVALAAWGLERKIRSLQRGWDSVHIPIIVKAGRYDAVVAGLESALHEAGLGLARKPASGWFEVPPRLLAAIGGDRVKDSIPTELVAFEMEGLGIVVYPSDVALLGREELVSQARAAVARRLTFADAYLTAAQESEQIEDRLGEIARKPMVVAADFGPIDELLTTLVVPYDDWETLYRLRLQVEHDRRLPESTAPADGS